MRQHLLKRVVSMLLAVTLVMGIVAPVYATDEGKRSIQIQKVDNDEVSISLLQGGEPIEVETDDAQTLAEQTPVRVSIVLAEKSTLEAGFDTEEIAENDAAMTYRAGLLNDQDTLVERIEAALGTELDVVWNLTLAANIISANVLPSQIHDIEQVPGVEKVVVEQTYKPMESVSSAQAKPNMVVSAGMTGAKEVWDIGSYGAGTRVAVIDTGLDTDHQSFDPAALQYAYEQAAEKEGKTYEQYIADLDLLDKDEIAEKLPQLNLHKLMPEITADDLYINLKAPYGINYIDRNKSITHDNDTASEHGSHVSGISSANRFIKKDCEFVAAEDSVYTLGNAPDSQIIVMKVFGENNPTDADYMAALEDAIILGCDVANLSLGGSNPGGTISLDYQSIMDSLVNTNTVVAIAAGNEGHWAAHATGPVPYLYVEDVGMQTASEPATYTNSLAVGSVDNDGAISSSLLFNGKHLAYEDGKSDWCDPMATLDKNADGNGTEYDYVMLTGIGKPEDYDGIDVEGKIVMVSRGEINFTEKADNAVEQGAIATLVYNNEMDVVHMVMEGYWESEPCAIISKADGDTIRAGSTKLTTEKGVDYYTGKISVDGKLTPIHGNHDYRTMSAFSSWGVPGDLSMKPEISAPGGNIYSVNGAVPETDQYEMMSGTSMATPQIAGMSALLMEYIRNNSLSQAGLTDRALAQSLLMSTADPMRDITGNYISVLQQGAGLANIRDAVDTDSYVLVDGQPDGKVKVELGDDPERTGTYTVTFTIHNLENEEQHYELSADLFTQDTFEGYANKKAMAAEDKTQMATYMASTTIALDTAAKWTVNGTDLTQANSKLAKCDFDGSGNIDRADAQALLDYVTGVNSSIENKDLADLSGDDKIDTYDVHVFLSQLYGGTVTVPAGGSTTVTATLSLTDAAKQFIQDTYPNGAYVEGYLFAKGFADAEGVAGTEHNIPVLGFYGSWTEPSMFELGNTQAKLSGQEIRTTYTGEGDMGENGDEVGSYNTMEVEYYRDPGYTYLLGGNPVDPTEIPNPERTAINNQNGDRIHGYKFSPIRNAAASRIQMTDEKGNVLFERFPGSYPGAYYGTMMFFTMWINSNFRAQINYVPGDLEEGESFTTSVTLAPEYNTNMAEEKADWDSLGHGATLSTTVRVDNTAPEIKGVKVGEGENPAITVTASDNQYVAGVALFDRGGRKVLSSTGSIADAKPGDTDEFVLDTQEVNGKKFLLQVFDYAYNVSTYELNMEIGDPVPMPYLMAHDQDYVEYSPSYWVGLDLNSTYRDLSIYAKNGVTLNAATMADPYIYAVAADGALYVQHKEDLLNPIRVGKLAHELTDMAYNPTNDTIYGVYQNEDGTATLCTMDKLTGDLTDLGTVGINTNTLAVTPEGVFYSNELGTSTVYKYTQETMTAPELVGECLNDGKKPFESKSIQNMEYDPNTGNVVWISYTFVPSSWGGIKDNAYLYEIKPDNSIVRHEDLMHHLTALVIPDKTASNPEQELTDDAVSLALTEDTVFMMKSQEHQLIADVLPWNASDRFVHWESSNPDVASVDGKGLVNAVGVGTATITATSRLNPTLTDTVTVHVNDIKVTVNGILADKTDKPSTFSWDFEKENTWTAGRNLDTDVMAATAKDDWTYFVTSGTGRTMKKIDFGSSMPLSTWSRIMSDLAYSKVFSTDNDLVHMICMTMWLPAKDLSAKPDGNAWDLSEVIQEHNPKANEFVGIASGGPIQYTEQDGTQYDAELLYLLDNQGGVLKLFAYKVDPNSEDYDPEYSYNAGAEYYPSDLLAQGYEVTYYNDNPLSSLVVGNDGNLYFAGYNGNSSELYQLTFDAESNSYKTKLFGDLGDGVWPVALTKVTVNEAENTANEPATAQSAPIGASVKKIDMLTGEEIKSTEPEISENSEPVQSETTEPELPENATQPEIIEPEVPESVMQPEQPAETQMPEVESAQPEADSAESAASVEAVDKVEAPAALDENLEKMEESIGSEVPVTNVMLKSVENSISHTDTRGADQKIEVVVTSDEAVPTNGLVKIKYDPKLLSLKTIHSEAPYMTSTLRTEGEVTFGYAAGMEKLPEGGKVSTLVFVLIQTEGTTELDITTLEANDKALNDTETVTVELGEKLEPDTEPKPEPKPDDDETTAPPTATPITPEQIWGNANSAIADAIASGKKVVVVDAGRELVVPAEVWQSFVGKDITVVIRRGADQFVFNGKTLAANGFNPNVPHNLMDLTAYLNNSYRPSPATGDTTHLVLWAVLAAVSGGAMIILKKRGKIS